MGEEPEEKRKAETENEASDNGEVKGGVFAAMNNVAGEAAETEREFAAEIEEGSDEDKYGSEDQESAAEITERIHEDIIEESEPGRFWVKRKFKVRENNLRFAWLAHGSKNFAAATEIDIAL